MVGALAKGIEHGTQDIVLAGANARIHTAVHLEIGSGIKAKLGLAHTETV